MASKTSTSETTKKLLDHLKKLQPSANKKEKQAMYSHILHFANNNDLSEDDIITLFAGDNKSRMSGLCELTGKKNSSGKFKESSKKILNIIHDLMHLSRRNQAFREGFVIYEDKIKEMQLEEHYSLFKSKDAEYAKKALEIIKVVIEKRPGLEMSDYIKIIQVDEIKAALGEYEKTKKIQDESKIKKAYYIDKIVSEAVGSLSLEPKTWDEVVKLKNKKLLTTEFLNVNYQDTNMLIDEDKHLEQEYINNFVDPLVTPPIKMNYGNFNEEERKKLHMQSESFDSVYFLEKLYYDASLKQFYFCLRNLEGNLEEVNGEDENLIDKNIYKYLDCKKLLDNILLNFKTDTHFTLTQLKSNLSNLQNKIVNSLNPLKISFDLILKSKSSKEIINKFSKYFMMKDKIEQSLKFSNFEELANNLKKINIEMKEISQNRYIYGEFYDFFSRKIEDFKYVLMKIIQESTVTDLIIKNFRYLLEFDIETETVDYLLNNLKEKMCEKIKNNLEYTENFEIKNFREFFSDEFPIENMSEEFYIDAFKQSEIFLNKDKNSMTQEYVNEIENFNSNNSKDSQTVKENFMQLNHVMTKKDLVNVESIISNLFDEIKDFLFMMKVLEETIKLKLSHMTSTKNTNFQTIVTEIYFIFFDKLKQFLFIPNFHMTGLMRDVFKEKKIVEILSFDDEKNIDYDFENDHVNYLFEFYENNSEIADTIFNKNFNKNSLLNLSNLLIDLFDLFEVYLNKDTLEMLNESKNETIEKLFLAFLNENIINNLNLFKDEYTINFFDTQISIFNFAAFAFTKNFLKNLFKSYKNIIEFYLNILKKTKDVTLNHDIITQSLFFTLKCFILKFYDFYETEKITSKDFKRLNCLILEIMKNFNYLRVEIKTIIKTIFKNKRKESEAYLEDLELFIKAIRERFFKEYVSNSAKILFNLYLSSTNVDTTQNDAGNMVNTVNNNFMQSYSYLHAYSYNFYEKYNELLMYDYHDSYNLDNTRSSIRMISGNNLPCFSDIRSVMIDMILYLAESIKELYQIEEENNQAECMIRNEAIMIENISVASKGNGRFQNMKKNSFENHSGYTQGYSTKITEIVCRVILNFLNLLVVFISDMSDLNKDPSVILSSQNNFSSIPKNFKIISQLYIELQLFQSVLSKYINSNEVLKEKFKKINIMLFNKLSMIRGKKEARVGEESLIFDKEEINRKSLIIEQYMSKYASYFKCFN